MGYLNRKINFLALVLLLIVSFGCIGQKKESGHARTDLPQAVVVRVIDGDTIVVNLNGMEERVRFIGIDTPESRVNKRAEIQSKEGLGDTQKILELGKKAKEFTASLVKPGDKVYLEFDVQKRDKYGRLLAYVYLQDGRMLNKEIICNGYAMPLTIPPNVKYEEEFRKCYKEARENRRGLWKE
jgi:micrococcal nuclease